MSSGFVFSRARFFLVSFLPFMIILFMISSMVSPDYRNLFLSGGDGGAADAAAAGSLSSRPSSSRPPRRKLEEVSSMPRPKGLASKGVEETHLGQRRGSDARPRGSGGGGSNVPLVFSPPNGWREAVFGEEKKTELEVEFSLPLSPSQSILIER